MGKKVTYFLQIEGKVMSPKGVLIPRMVDWTEQLTYPCQLAEIQTALVVKAKALELVPGWSLIHLQCFSR